MSAVPLCRSVEQMRMPKAIMTAITTTTTTSTIQPPPTLTTITTTAATTTHGETTQAAKIKTMIKANNAINSPTATSTSPTTTKTTTLPMMPTTNTSIPPNTTTLSNNSNCSSNNTNTNNCNIIIKKQQQQQQQHNGICHNVRSIAMLLLNNATHFCYHQKQQHDENNRQQQQQQHGQLQQQQKQQKQQKQNDELHRDCKRTMLALLLLLLINITYADETSPLLRSTNLEAKVGSHAVFNCHINFPFDAPIPYVVHWSKDNKKIFTWYKGEVQTNDLYVGRLHLVQNHSEFGNASVNLTAIRESDQGFYHCQINFPNRSPSARNNGTSFQLTVQGGSLIKIPPVNQTIMEGQTAFFHCAMKYPNSSVVSWYKDGVLLQDVQDLVRRAYIGKDGSLSIDPTMMSDLGEYECNVHSKDDEESQAAKAFLNIQYKAKVIYAPPEVYLPYGQPAVLDCHFRANPPLKNLRWEKDGLLFDSYNVPGVFYKMNGSLYFSKVNENHAGSYTCTPYNDLGTDGPSPVISVIVLRPPIFSIGPKAIYIQKLGETVNIPCEAIDRDGNNRPTIVWARKDGTPLPTERHTISGGNLTITHLIESDRGLYECSATNEAATITAETELMIENIAPRPPYNLTANSTETTITIRWQPGYLRPSLEYTVWYRVTDGANWRTLRVLQENVMEATIEHLQPGQEYEFMVLSQDKYGEGMFSKQFRFSTLESQVQSAEELQAIGVAAVGAGIGVGGSSGGSAGVGGGGGSGGGSDGGSVDGMAISAPWNLTATKNQQGWLLHWEHPKRGLNALRFYTLRWWKEPEHFLIGDIETYETFHQVRQLKDDASYKVQITATSIDGAEVVGDELTIDVPAHRKMRALLIGSSVGVIFLLCALCVFLYVKRNCLRHLFTGDNNSNANDDDDDDDDDDCGSSGRVAVTGASAGGGIGRNGGGGGGTSLSDAKVREKMNNA